MRRIEVVSYDPGWPEEYAREAGELSEVFCELLLSIHHIGSTAIPGMRAKPIIDIMPVVRDIDLIDALNPVMEGLGYTVKGENGIPGRRYFRKGSDIHHTHHVHVYEPDHAEVARHLDFRDYLRSHSLEAEAYSQLKVELTRCHTLDILAYSGGKSVFIEEVIGKARAWRMPAG
jgi:GrpB-like predicted nucleotidyltransferase (UPF0157 family)